MQEVVEALRELRRQHPNMRKAVVKLNDGFSGDGNAIFSFEKSPHIDEDTLRRHLKIVAEDLTYDVFAEKMALMGGIVEGFIDGAVKTSPSVQCRFNPLQKLEIVSTHDQVLSGESGQVYVGATFPAQPAYARDLGMLAFQLGEVMQPLGILGRFGIDFVSVKEAEGWKHYCIEINLRKGGTTHPYLMLQFLTWRYWMWKLGDAESPGRQHKITHRKSIPISEIENWISEIQRAASGRWFFLPRLVFFSTPRCTRTAGYCFIIHSIPCSAHQISERIISKNKHLRAIRQYSEQYLCC